MPFLSLHFVTIAPAIGRCHWVVSDVTHNGGKKQPSRKSIAFLSNVTSALSADVMDLRHFGMDHTQSKTTSLHLNTV